MNKFRILFNNPTLSTWYYTFTKGLIFAVLTGYIITKFDDYLITCWYLFSTISALIHFFDLGFSTTLIRFVSYARVSKNKDEELKNLYNIFNSIYGILTVLAVISIITGYYIWVKPILNNDSNQTINKSYLIFSFGTLIAFFMKRNDAFLKGLDEISLYYNWNSLFTIIQGIFLIIVISLNGDFLSLIITQQSVIIINSIKNFLLTRTKMRGTSWVFALSKSEFLKYWRPTWKSAVISLSTMGVNQFSAAFIPIWYDIKISASYFFSLKLLSFIGEFSYAPFYSRIPKFIKGFKDGSFTQTRNEGIKTLFESIRSTFLILLIGIISLNYIGRPIIDLFKPNTNLVSNTLFVLLCYYFLVERINGIFSQIIMFNNDIEHYKNYLLSAAIFLIIIISFKDLGIWVLPLAYIFSYSITSIGVVKKAMYTINRSPKTIIKYMTFTIILWCICTILIKIV
ncbi:MAG: hypothetical protein HWE24_03600 [Oceanospirillaceae bacterium]|nr:hypothetical protein [Oceanospirillaceae bacterium]